MSREPRDGYSTARDGMRAAGPVVLAVGVILLVITLVDFFGSTGNGHQPTIFWLGFIALPMIAAGWAMTAAGYQREVTTYQARQVRGAVREVSSAARQGWTGDDTHACPACGEPAKPDDTFCDQCGRPLDAPACPKCGEANNPDARFCSVCGGPIPR